MTEVRWRKRASAYGWLAVVGNLRCVVQDGENSAGWYVSAKRRIPMAEGDVSFSDADGSQDAVETAKQRAIAVARALSRTMRRRKP